MSSTASIRLRLATDTRSLRAAPQPIETWSSCIAEVGSESTDAGAARRRFSAAIAAWVYWAIIRPESTPASGARKAGRPWERDGSSRRSVRRSLIAPTSAAAIARKSQAIATGAPWKFPHDSTRPSGRTIGLSIAEASSASATRSAWATVSRAAPLTCGLQRIEYGSWTRGSSVRWLATIAEPPSSRRRLAALAACPSCGRRAIRSSAKARSVPSSASVLAAAATSARRRSGPRSARARISIPRMPSVPLISARPSFGPSTGGSIPARSSAAAAGTGRSSASSTSPSPSIASAQWASGARSPLAPSDPCSGTTGSSPSASIATIVSASSGRAPEKPIASDRALSRNIARTASRSIGGPMPAACERISARCSSARRSAGIRVCASDPNPVETP